MKCIKCGKETNSYLFKVLQVQTLHIRDVTKEKRVQALGDFEEYHVCRQCAEEKYAQHIHTAPRLKKIWTLFGLLTAAGLLVTLFFWKGEGVFRLLGLGMAACGILCILGQTKAIRAKELELYKLSEEEALYQCAWECLIDGAPKKNDINDITYIPVDEKNMARKNGDLMILYELLPEIAIQAYNRIHGLEEQVTE